MPRASLIRGGERSPRGTSLRSAGLALLAFAAASRPGAAQHGRTAMPDCSPLPPRPAGFALPLGELTPGLWPNRHGEASWQAWWTRHQDHYFALARARADRGTPSEVEPILRLLAGRPPLQVDATERARLVRQTAPHLRAQLAGREALGHASRLAWARLSHPEASRPTLDRKHAQDESQTESLLLAGISGRPEARALLAAALHGDDEDNRVAAAFGLALLTHSTPAAEDRLAALRDLGELLGSEPRAPDRVQAAGARALGIAASALRTPTEAAEATRLAVELLPLLEERHRPADLRAQLPLSLALLLAPDPAASSARVVLSARCCVLVQERGAGIAERYGAVQALGLLLRPNEGALDPPLQLLAKTARASPFRELRPAAILALGRAIGRLGWAEPAVARWALPELLRQVEDGQYERPRWAALALGIAAADTQATGFGPTPEPVLASLRRKLARSHSAETRDAVCLALGLAGAASAAEAMRAHALHPTGLSGRAEAIDGLALLGEEGAIPGLRDAYRCASLEPATRRAIGRALVTLGDPTALPRIRQELDSRDPERALAAASLLPCLPDSRLLDAVLDGLTQRSRPVPVRAGWTRALARLGDHPPGALRRACLQGLHPWSPSPFDAWLHEM